jgi:hypothetical protein
MEKHAREFRGKTELDIEAQFSRWQQANAGLVFNVKRHPIERLPLPVMLVEYETKTHDRDRPRKRAK